ncbi:MAG: hypothetical protein M1826_000624 [Phylliscum demangeonii]|nr:MAG: hypothetical protein M1826_000624 [Phylliscum demangeonii]
MGKYTLPVLGNDNYKAWAGDMQLYLIGRRLWNIVSRDRPRFAGSIGAASSVNEGSSKTMTGSQAQTDWDTANAQVAEAIYSSVDRIQLTHILDIRIAAHQWLENVGNMSINEAVARLNSLQLDIRNVDPLEAPSDTLKTNVLFAGLGSHYRTIITILSGDANLTFTAAVSRLRDEELKRSNRIKDPAGGLHLG